MSDSDKEQIDRPEPLLEEGKFDSEITGNTAYIRWDVKGGRDRDHYPSFDTWEPLEGTPNIQGFTCRSAVDLWIYIGDESEKFSGPTEGKKKIDARRTSKYKIVRR